MFGKKRRLIMLLTQNEVIELIRFAICKTASTLGISEVEWKSSDELLPQIETEDSQTYKLLTSFINAYSAWFSFHKEIERLGKTGNLSLNEQQTLTKNVQNRNSTRQAILNKLKEIAEQQN